MDEHEDTGAGRGAGSEGWADDVTHADETVGRADPLVEGAPVGAGPREAGAAGGSSAGEAAAAAGGDEADLGLPVGAPASSHAWVGAATAVGLGLMVVELFVLLGTVAQGLAVDRLDGDILHKLGVAFLSNVGSANGLTIIAAAVLVALPVLVGAPLTESQNSRRAMTLALGAMLALVVVLATPIAIRARLHVLDVGNQPVDALARRVLGTYTIGTLGTAAAALGACLGLARAGLRGGTAADPGETVTPHP